MTMDDKARRAWKAIRRCVADGRYSVLPHFVQRMDQHGLFWPDVQAVIDKPSDVRDDGLDRFDRSKWIISGTAIDPGAPGPIEIVCALDEDEQGRVTVFITVY